LKVKIEGRYTCGHQYERVVELAEPEPHPPITDVDWWSDWWWEVVFPHTGDGVFGSYGGWAAGTILQADDEALVGACYEWTD
jgi:hypothetical protein